MLPTPYVVQQMGYRPGFVALTFDDGPDADWTPRILDILKQKSVPGTFFVVGANALSQPSLLNRIVAEGHELGNHSYTHPNMALISDRAVQLELNATERLVEAYTGHGMRLFRAPFFGDAEPTTADELGPALAAQQRGYLNVGLHVDTEDWQRPGVETIIDNARARSARRQCRPVAATSSCSTTAAATVPRPWPRCPSSSILLKARGYRFVRRLGSRRSHARAGDAEDRGKRPARRPCRCRHLPRAGGVGGIPLLHLLRRDHRLASCARSR